MDNVLLVNQAEEIGDFLGVFVDLHNEPDPDMSIPVPDHLGAAKVVELVNLQIDKCPYFQVVSGFDFCPCFGNI